MMPEPAFLGLHDRHRRAGDRVHVGRDERALERDVLREAARQVDRGGVAPLDDAVLRPQQEIVERAAAHGISQQSGPSPSLIRYRSPAVQLSLLPLTAPAARRVAAPR